MATESLWVGWAAIRLLVGAFDKPRALGALTSMELGRKAQRKFHFDLNLHTRNEVRGVHAMTPSLGATNVHNRKRRRIEFGGSRLPRKIRELLADLTSAGFSEIAGGGKGSHRKLVHSRYPGVVTLSGGLGADAKPYQEKQVRRAVEKVHETE